jgi:hypothetical protein
MYRNAIDGRDATTAGSIFERVLGDDFAALAPPLQTYFGAIPLGHVGVGAGRFDEVGLRVRALAPAFAALVRLGVAFPERQTDVPFDVRNEVGVDGARHAVRRFHFQGVTRTMTDRMDVVSGRLVDRLGGLLEVELALCVAERDLRMISRRLALRVGGVRVPLPHLARVELVEGVDAGVAGVQRVAVSVRMPVLGEVYGYRGSFRYAIEPAPPGVPTP